MKVVINRCFGGFSLSKKAKDLLIEAGFTEEAAEDMDFSSAIKDRSNPVLVEIVEKLGEDADGRFAKLKVVEIPDDIDVMIDEYDGSESVHETHRIWD